MNQWEEVWLWGLWDRGKGREEGVIGVGKMFRLGGNFVLNFNTMINPIKETSHFYWSNKSWDAPPLLKFA